MSDTEANKDLELPRVNATRETHGITGESANPHGNSVAPHSAVSVDVDCGTFRNASASFLDIFKQFVLLGWTAFGGPQTHIAIFQKRFVEKLHWLSDPEFIQLFTLGQFMPGPTSTQVSFALGTVKQGVPGGLMSGCLFQYPGAIIMTLVAVFAAKSLGAPPGWLRGLAAGVAAAGVALVASACKSLCDKLCATRMTALCCIGAAVLAYYHPVAWMFPSVIAAGGIVAMVVDRKKEFPPPRSEAPTDLRFGLNHWGGGAVIAAWAAVLVLVVVLVRTLDSPSTPLRVFELFYRTGSIIFGGGQVVLPLLFSQVVSYDCDSAGKCSVASNTWVTPEQFYAGLGIVQALPGPLFNFSAYLGVTIAYSQGFHVLLGAVLAWLGLFGPGVLLIFGILPFWGTFRNWAWYKRAMPGLNAAAIGLVVTSVFTLTFGAVAVSPFPVTSVCLGILAYGASSQLKLFEPAIVIAGAVLGIAAWGIGMD